MKITKSQIKQIIQEELDNVKQLQTSKVELNENVEKPQKDESGMRWWSNAVEAKKYFAYALIKQGVWNDSSADLDNIVLKGPFPETPANDPKSRKAYIASGGWPQGPINHPGYLAIFRLATDKGYYVAHDMAAMKIASNKEINEASGNEALEKATLFVMYKLIPRARNPRLNHLVKSAAASGVNNRQSLQKYLKGLDPKSAQILDAAYKKALPIAKKNVMGLSKKWEMLGTARKPKPTSQRRGGPSGKSASVGDIRKKAGGMFDEL